MKLTIVFVLMCLLCSAGGPTHAASIPSLEEVHQTLAEAIQYLDQTQKKETSGTDYFSGEWPSYMLSALRIPLIGPVGTGGYDSNSFTVSSIHNILASIWKRQPTFESIPPMLDLSIERILSYKSGDSFNFWPLLEPKLYKPTDHNMAKIRRPNHFPIKYSLLEAGCNVYNDADDTAVAFSAIKHYRDVRPETSVELPKNIGEVFSPYRDRKRMISHFYNALHLTVRTGAFMTWLEPEHAFNPITYFPSKKRVYLPFGQNDVDCVVNANVLNALASYEKLDTPGVEEACKYLEWSFKTGRQKSCGVYYPSPYNAHYSVAKAFHAGARCLQNTVDLAVLEIIQNQNKDGSWSSDIPGDDVHTSLYALNALLYARDSDKERSPDYLEAIHSGIQFTLDARESRPHGSSAWEQGVFFSGGTFSRHWIYWKSEPYTTALAADALSLYLIQQHTPL